MTAPILPPLSDADWPADAVRLRDGFAGKLNVYRVMAHHPALLGAWETLRNHVVLDSALGATDREIVILRVGHRWGAAYEWGQHVVRGRAAGLSDRRIARAGDAAGADDDADAAHDRALIGAVDALLDDGRLAPGQLGALTDAIGQAAVFDLMATVGMYTTLAFIVKSFETPLEPDIAAAAAATGL